ncbi:hypothetical protein [Candidatus Leptofilum sp.]|uniref:hypothetical protein n=1 Tax=Candidatus Leptofilum sp. TaxID=3241576 RepID=UPI003B5CE785
MLQEFRARLSKNIEQKRLKIKLEQDLQAVKTEIHEQSARLASLETRLKQERDDIEELESISIKTLFYQVLGSHEQQLEKERQELLAAQLLHQQTKQQIVFLDEEQNRLIQQLRTLDNVEAEYKSLLSEKENLLRKSNNEVARKLIKCTEQIAALESEIKEISEAITAGNVAVFRFNRVTKSLQSAESWGAWDLLGGGLISTAVKHSRVDDARKGIHDVQKSISQFKRELADVGRYVDLHIDIGEFESFADFVFDGLIIDWVVQSKISNSLARSRNVSQKIKQAVLSLEDQKKVFQNKRDELLKKRVQIIESN